MQPWVKRLVWHIAYWSSIKGSACISVDLGKDPLENEQLPRLKSSVKCQGTLWGSPTKVDEEPLDKRQISTSNNTIVNIHQEIY